MTSDEFPFLFFYELDFGEALQLLTAAASIERGKYLSEIEICGQLIQSSSDSLERVSSLVTLIVDKRVVNSRMLMAMRKSNKHYKTGSDPKAFREEKGLDKLNIYQLINAVLTSCKKESQGNTKSSDRELLVLARVETAGQVAEFFQVLAFHATNVRVAIADGPGMPTLALFHVLDDRIRHSTVNSVRATGAYPELCWLTCHRTPHGTICLPQCSDPMEKTLNLVGQFMSTASDFFDTKRNADVDSQLLLAVVPADQMMEWNEQRHTLLYLPSLRFTKQYEVAEPASDYADVQLVSLQNSTDLGNEALSQAIREAEPAVGYRLRLRRTRLALYPYDQDPELADLEEVRLIEHINSLEHQLAYVRSSRIPKPVLLRFTQAQLPALADFLREKPSLLENPQSYNHPDNLPFRYAFEARPTFPDGYHYLLVNPYAATERDYAHLAPWRKEGDSAEMRFWLDPFWSAYAPRMDRRCYVFVPYGMMLFPSLHSWEIDDLDIFLRKTLQAWLDDQNQTEMPATPLYVFDTADESHGYAPGGKDIRVSVLDQQQFGSLSVKLPWLNANLILHTEMTSPVFWEELYAYISDAADAKMQTQLRSQKMKSTAETRDKFEREAKQVKDRVTRSVQALANSISTQLERIAKESATAISDAQKLNRDLQRVKKDYDYMLSLLEGIRDKQESARKDAQKLQGNAAQVNAEVEKAVAEAERVINHMETMVSRKLKKLDTVEREQRQRLSQIRFRFWESE